MAALLALASGPPIPWERDAQVRFPAAGSPGLLPKVPSSGSPLGAGQKSNTVSASIPVQGALREKSAAGIRGAPSMLLQLPPPSGWAVLSSPARGGLSNLRGPQDGPSAVSFLS